MTDWRRFYWRFLNAILDFGSVSSLPIANSRRSHYKPLFISFGIIAVGIVGVVVSGLLDEFLPHADPKFGPGFIPGLLSLAVIALGMFCSLLSGIWCLWLFLSKRGSR